MDIHSYFNDNTATTAATNLFFIHGICVAIVILKGSKYLIKIKIKFILLLTIFIYQIVRLQIFHTLLENVYMVTLAILIFYFSLFYAIQHKRRFYENNFSLKQNNKNLLKQCMDMVPEGIALVTK